jgi:hypothetical protein
MKTTAHILIWSAALVSGVFADAATSPAGRYRDIAAQHHNQGADFDAIFARLCREVMATVVSSNVTSTLGDESRLMFSGLWLWLRAGGKPVLAGRGDLAQHFVSGGMFEGLFDAGQAAGIRKEDVDSESSGNVADLDDLAATICGAKWVELAAQSDQDKARDWVRTWADGSRSLSRSLPAFKYGRLPAGQKPSSQIIEKIRTDIQSTFTNSPPRQSAPQ